jgi:hypothetical protein
MTTLTLHAALRACAAGIHPLEAGVELLIAHDVFTSRDDFTSRFINHSTSITNGSTGMAKVDWPAAINALDTELPCSGGLSELKTIMNISCSRDFSGRTPDGGDQELDVAVIKAGEGVLEIDGHAVGEACRDLQHPLLAPGARET